MPDLKKRTKARPSKRSSGRSKEASGGGKRGPSGAKVKRAERPQASRSAQRRPGGDLTIAGGSGAEIVLDVKGSRGGQAEELVLEGLRSYGAVIDTEWERLDSLSQPDARRAVDEAARAAQAAIQAIATPDAPRSQLWAEARESIDSIYVLLHQVVERYDLGRAAVQRQAEAAAAAARAVLGGRDAVIERIQELLSEDGDTEGRHVDELNEARHVALMNRVRSESLSGKQLEAWGLSRQRLHQLREENRLFAVKIPQVRGLSYPRWQFDPEALRPRDGLNVLVEAAKTYGIDPLSFHLMMTNPDAGDGTPPHELLEHGAVDRVLSILRANSR
jgi:hypothetical protein